MTASSNPMIGRSESVPAGRATSRLDEPSLGEQALEVLGTVPVWVLGGMRLERLGERTMPDGWTVGVYQMDLAEFESGDSSLAN